MVVAVVVTDFVTVAVLIVVGVLVKCTLCGEGGQEGGGGGDAGGGGGGDSGVFASGGGAGQKKNHYNHV